MIQHERLDKTVNEQIRICVNCGNTDILVQNGKVSCKECGFIFDVVKKP